MNVSRCLIAVIVFGMAASPGYAVPVLFTLEEDPFTQWDFVQRDSDGTLTSKTITDTDGDGITILVSQIGPSGARVAFQSKSGRSGGAYAYYFVSPQSIGDGGHGTGFLRMGTGDPTGAPLIVELLGASSVTLSLGQQWSVSGGVIPGLNSIVHVNEGMTSADDLLAVDLRSLPTFTGDAVVTGLLTVEVVPEPATLTLLWMASGLLLRRARQNSSAA